MIQDFGAWAEDHFSGLCARVGATRNKSQQDRTGWDYLVEFAPAPHGGAPADLRPPGHTVLVQVKSKARGRPFVDLKLSNALRFAKDSLPCFIVLYCAAEGAEPVRIFAKHVWDEAIRAILLRARQAHADGRDDLHRMSIRLSFDDADDHTSDLISWMHDSVTQRTRYAEEKLELNRVVGFEGAWISGSMRLARDDLAALVDHQIGLTPTAPPIDITLRESRFGIAMRTPLVSGPATMAHMQSHPTSCRVRVRSRQGKSIWLDGQLFRPGIPGLPEVYWKARIVADCVQMILHPDGNVTVNLRFDDARKSDLTTLGRTLDIAQMALQGEFDVSVHADGIPALRARAVIEDRVANRPEFSEIRLLIDCLEQASSGITPSDLVLSIDDIVTALPNSLDFYSLINGTDFTMSGKFESAPSNEYPVFESMLFYVALTVGEWVFGVIVQRDILKFEVKGCQLNLALGEGRVVEGVVRRGTVADIAAELRELVHVVQSQEEGSLVLCEGDYRAMLALSKA